MLGSHSQAAADAAHNTAGSNDLRFLSGGGEIGRILRSGSGLPASMQTPASWPDSIKTLVAVILCAKQPPMYVAWGNGRNQVYNDAFIPILRQKHPSALGQPLFDVWHEAADELLPLVDKAYGGEPTQSGKMEILAERGGRLEPAWFSFFHAPVLDANGDVIGIFCACNEITEQHLAQQAAAATSQRYKDVIEVMSEGFLLLDEQYRVLEMNAEGLRVSQRELGQLVGRSLWELWPGSLGSPLEAAHREAMLERRPVSVRHHYTAEGYDNWVDLRIYPVPEGGVAVFFRDINEPIRAEAQLRASEARFRAAVTAIGVMWINNADGEMVGEQPGWSQITGQSAAQYQGYGWTHAVHPDDVQSTVEAWQRSVKSQSLFQHEHRVRVQSGQWRLFSIRAVPVFDADQQITEWVGVHIDITEARRTEQELREADQRKDEFLATLAHELRNPLAPIRTAARVLSQPDVNAASVRTCADILARQAGHMALLLDDLLDISRITSGRLELKKAVVTVRAIVEAAVEAARPGIVARGHHLTVSLPDEVIELDADSLRLSQVLT
ncbi:MAG: PAS domain-containing protein, partial [Pseudomonadota bacterium]|nr:PAS domain-containing protein [Pseudomonadota bacterium]